MTFIDLSTATWPEAGDAFRRGLIVVLPVGAQEQHGAHLPLATDTTLAAGVARRLAIAIGGGLLPAIPYGEAASAEGWPGTLSLSAATLEAVVLDIGRGVKRMGATALVTLNGHFGNRAPIERAAVALRDEGSGSDARLSSPRGAGCRDLRVRAGGSRFLPCRRGRDVDAPRPRPRRRADGPGGAGVSGVSR